MKNTPLFVGYEWDVDLIEKVWPLIDKIGKEDLGLDYYQPQFDIVTSDQMIDAYSSIGMPIFYNHWSFGKSAAKYQRDYKAGKMGLAYEMVINSNPCLAYMMEDNTAMMTTLVMAHANVGHAAVFKMNYLFRQHTNPDTILNFLEYAKKYITKCENQYGQEEVENLLDALHVINKFGADKYPHNPEEKEEVKQARALEILQSQERNYDSTSTSPPTYNRGFKHTWKNITHLLGFFEEDTDSVSTIQMEEENLLRVVEDYSLVLAPWEKEIVRIMRKIEQYFFPQRQTKTLNEGFACFCHYYIMTELHTQGHIDDGAYLEFLESHTAVCYQPDMAHLNPYALGFEMFMDIKRACENPDEEDYKYLSSIAGKKDWRKELKNIVKYYKDESFVLQFLSPKVIRKFKLFVLKDDSGDDDYYEITGIQSDRDIDKIRDSLARQLEIDNYLPSLEVTKIDRLNNVMTISYRSYKERELDAYAEHLLRAQLSALTGLDIEFSQH